MALSGSVTDTNQPSFNPIKFFAYRNAALTNTDANRMPFDTELFDTGSNFDSTGTIGLFTAPIAGFYSFSAACVGNYASTGQDNECILRKNGSDYIIGQRWVSTYNAGAFGEGSGLQAPLVQLAASDTVDVRFINGGTAMIVGASPIQTWFSGFLLSRT